jgi:hypothetical protein
LSQRLSRVSTCNIWSQAGGDARVDDALAHCKHPVRGCLQLHHPAPTGGAAPFLFGVLLAIALGGYLLVRFASDLVSGLRASSAPRRMSAA